MGGDPEVAPPSPAEERLRNEQTNLLRTQQSLLTEQKRQQDLLAPILFEEAGIRQVTDPETGEVTGFERIDDPNEALREEIETGFLERTRAAQRGELPVNPALLRDLKTGRETLRESLRKQLGPGFETSTPGIEALGRFGETETNVLESARRGDLTTAEALGLQRQGGNQQLIDSLLGRTGGLAARDAPIAAGFGATAAGFSNPLNFLLQDRAQQNQANIASSQSRSQVIAGIAGGAGQLGGAALGFSLLGSGGPKKALRLT